MKEYKNYKNYFIDHYTISTNNKIRTLEKIQALDFNNNA